MRHIVLNDHEGCPIVLRAKDVTFVRAPYVGDVPRLFDVMPDAGAIVFVDAEGRDDADTVFAVRQTVVEIIRVLDANTQVQR